MFLAQSTRPDLVFAVHLLSRFSTGCTQVHCNSLKRVLRYLRGKTDLGIRYSKTKNGKILLGYSDADFARDAETRRSTTGYIYLLAGGPISWCSRRQAMVTLSTTEAEYVAAAEAARELVWLRLLLSDVGCRCEEPTELRIDNQSAIKLVKNPEFHRRTKHIDNRYHFIREKYAEDRLVVTYVKSEEQCADFLTKPLLKEKFNVLLRSVGMYERSKALE